MIRKRIDVLELDVPELIKLLNKAFADEWLAYYQYWAGAQLVKGPMKSAVVTELNEHAQDELEHAERLSKRIIQLGGTPLLEPKEFYEYTNCGITPPTDPQVRTLLEQNIKGEQCAIDVYNQLLKMTKDKDEVTNNLMLELMEDEMEHEHDLQILLEDLDLMCK